MDSGGSFDVGADSYGTWIKVADSEVADQFDDFLAEQDVSTLARTFEDDGVVFWFEKEVRSPADVGEIYSWFCRVCQPTA